MIKAQLVIVMVIYGVMAVAVWWPQEDYSPAITSRVAATLLMLIPAVLAAIVWAQHNELERVRKGKE